MFAILDPENLRVESSTKIIEFPKCHVRHFEKWKSDRKFVISDPKSPGVQSSTKRIKGGGWRARTEEWPSKLEVMKKKANLHTLGVWITDDWTDRRKYKNGNCKERK